MWGLKTKQKTLRQGKGTGTGMKTRQRVMVWRGFVEGVGDGPEFEVRCGGSVRGLGV